MKKVKHSHFLATLAVFLVLSHTAQSAAAAAGKGPLTEAEQAQCQAQIVEVNKRVLAYNAELEAMKALEAEVGALGAAIEKDQDTADRRDGAAMKALNTQIAKNNALVARHAQMRAGLKAMSTEHQERSAKFSAACENRPVAL